MNSSPSPLERYRQDLQRQDFVADAQQERAVRELDRIHHELLAGPPAPVRDGGGLFGLLRRASRAPAAAPVRGLYLWGGVGRGKTYLVDTFHEGLPFEARLRIHFHRFMQRIHAELRSLDGQQDPLLTVAERIAAQARVLTFDEFHVSDITDAMLLGRLLDALFSRGVTLVATSNIEPDGLYAQGLQRARFLPAIDLIKRHTVVLELGGDTDYRLRALEQAEIYHCPLDAEADASLARSFESIAGSAGEQGGVLEVLGRDIALRRQGNGVAWFGFDDLCDGPRGAADYIEIARLFHSVLISDVPTFGRGDNDRAARFIMLVDEFYDRSVNLVVSAAAEPDALYLGSRHEFAFQRTASRLMEMRSREYLHRPHLP